MARKRKLVKAENGGFAGVDNSTAPTKLSPDTSQVSVNSDTSRPKLLQVRRGFSRGDLAKFAFPSRAALWWVARDGVDKLIHHDPGSGYLIGIDWPDEEWPREPIVGGPADPWNPGGVGPGGVNFPPVTNLAVSDTNGLTLTWTNPVTPFLAGVRVIRRTDRYPVSLDDGVELLDAKLSTVTDSALTAGQTGYYAVLAYSRTRWSVAKFISGVKTVNRLQVLDTTGDKAYYSADDGSTWAEATSTWTSAVFMGGSSSKVYVIGDDGANTFCYVSSDYGATYTKGGQVLTGVIGGGWSYPTNHFFSGASGRVIFYHSTKVYYSDDSGATWSAGVEPSAGKVVEALASDGAGNVYAVCETTANNPLTVHVSSDNGATFGASVGTVADMGSGSRNSGLVVCTNGNLVLANRFDSTSDYATYVSTNGGVNWTDTTESANAFGAIGAVGNLVSVPLVPADSWIKSADGGANWASVSGTLNANVNGAYVVSGQVCFSSPDDSIYRLSADMTTVESLATVGSGVVVDGIHGMKV